MTAWLLTWLWQGTAVAAVVAIVLRCAPRLNAATRHLVWFAALVVLVWLGWGSVPHAAVTALKGCATVTGGTGLQQATGGTGLQLCPAAPIYVPTAPGFLVSIFIGIWAAIALINLVRLLPALRRLYALRDRCRSFPPRIELGLPLWLEAKGRGRRADLMLCDDVPGATVLGLQRPCIAIPPSLVQALTIGELDQVILHEHAHVQRRDDWSRLVETLLLSVLWIHPAAVYIARALNREREMACDEWVVARTGEAKAYARCLTRAAEVGGRIRTRPMLVTRLLGGRHELVRRVDRLLATKGAVRRRISFTGAAVATCAIAALSVHVHGVRFAEIADVVLPHVPGPMMPVYNGATAVIAHVEADVAAATVTVRLKPDTTDVAPSVPIESASPTGSAHTSSAAIETLHARTIAPDAPIAPNASSFAPITLVAFTAAPAAQTASADKTADRPNPWAAPGVEIASAAKKTSIGLANVFSRVGVSLARSF